MSHSTPHKGKLKLERTHFPGTPTTQLLRKPAWIRARVPSGEGVMRIKSLLRTAALHTVCEEASCPNLGECFSNGTATFLIMGNLCTRRCPFCDVGHGQPLPLDPNEPIHLAETIATLGLHHVVVTSVDRDDLRDGGAAHFAACVRAIRTHTSAVCVETLVPDFRGRMETALDLLSSDPPDIFNHNLETVPRIYRQVRPGADYLHSLSLLRAFAIRHPNVPTKSGLMLGLGETQEEVEEVLRDLHIHGCDRITLGQYLQPSRHHLPVVRFAPPDEFASLQRYAKGLGFTHIASGPMVRSSYHAELQAAGQAV